MGGCVGDGAQHGVGYHCGEERPPGVGGVEARDKDGHGGDFEEGDDEVEEWLWVEVWVLVVVIKV